MINLAKKNKPWVVTVNSAYIKAVEERTGDSVYKIQTTVTPYSEDDDTKLYVGTGFYFGGDYTFDLTPFAESFTDHLTNVDYGYNVYENENEWEGKFSLYAFIELQNRNGVVLERYVAGNAENRPELNLEVIPNGDSVIFETVVDKRNASLLPRYMSVYPVYYIKYQGRNYMLDTMFLTETYNQASVYTNLMSLVDFGVIDENTQYSFYNYVLNNNHMFYALRGGVELTYKLLCEDRTLSVAIDNNASQQLSFEPLKHIGDDESIPERWSFKMDIDEFKHYYNENMKSELEKTANWPKNLMNYVVGVGISYCGFRIGTNNCYFGRVSHYVPSECPTANLVLFNSDINGPGNEVVVPLRVENGLLKGTTTNKLTKIGYINQFEDAFNSDVKNNYILTAYIDPEWLKSTTKNDIEYMKVMTALQSARRSYMYGNCGISGMIGEGDFHLDCHIKNVEEIVLYSRYTLDNKVPSLRIEIEIFR